MPYSGPQPGKKQLVGEDYGAVLWKRAEGEVLEVEGEEGEEPKAVLTVEQGRAVSREKQDLLIALKWQRTIRPMPGRLVTRQAADPRAALPPGPLPAPPCGPPSGRSPLPTPSTSASSALAPPRRS